MTRIQNCSDSNLTSPLSKSNLARLAARAYALNRSKSLIVPGHLSAKNAKRSVLIRCLNARLVRWYCVATASMKKSVSIGILASYMKRRKSSRMVTAPCAQAVTSSCCPSVSTAKLMSSCANEFRSNMNASVLKIKDAASMGEIR